jgi:hypothetical protein
MIDPATGYAYSSDGGFSQINIYRKNKDGVMRNQDGASLQVPVSTYQQDGIISSQASQDLTTPAPYHHLETTAPNFWEAEADVEAGYVDGVDVIGKEAAYAFFGVRWATGNADVGLYSAPWHNDTSQRPVDSDNEYWGIFATAGPDTWMDFSPAWNNPPVAKKGIPWVWIKSFEKARIRVRVWGTEDCVYRNLTTKTVIKPINDRDCNEYFFPKGTVRGWIEVTVSGQLFLQEENVRRYTTGTSITYIYTPTQGLTFQGSGNCNTYESHFDPNRPGHWYYEPMSCHRKTSLQGWNFYRSTTLLTGDDVSAVWAKWSNTKLMPGNRYIAGNYIDVTASNSKYIEQNFAETPSLRCPDTGVTQADGTLYSKLNKDYSWVDTGYLGTFGKKYN